MTEFPKNLQGTLDFAAYNGFTTLERSAYRHDGPITAVFNAPFNVPEGQQPAIFIATNFETGEVLAEEVTDFGRVQELIAQYV